MRFHTPPLKFYLKDITISSSQMTAWRPSAKCKTLHRCLVALVLIMAERKHSIKKPIFWVSDPNNLCQHLQFLPVSKKFWQKNNHSISLKFFSRTNSQTHDVLGHQTHKPLNSDHRIARKTRLNELYMEIHVLFIRKIVRTPGSRHNQKSTKQVPWDNLAVSAAINRHTTKTVMIVRSGA